MAASVNIRIPVIVIPDMRKEAFAQGRAILGFVQFVAAEYRRTTKNRFDAGDTITAYDNCTFLLDQKRCEKSH